MLHKASLAAACALMLVATLPLSAQTPVRGGSSASTSRSSTTTVRAASSGAKTTTTGSSQSGRATIDRRETTVSNSNVTNKGLTTVRTTTAPSRTTSTQSSSATPVRSGGTTASSSSTSRSGSTASSSGSTVRSGSSTASSSSATQSSGTTVRQSSGTASQTARQQGSTQTSHSQNASQGTSQQSGSSVSRTSQSGTAVRSNSNVTAKPQNTGRPERNDTYTDRGGNYRYGGAGNMNVYGDGRDVQRMPPMDRPPIPYSAPAIFNKKRPHYYGYNIAAMPHGYIVKKYWGRDYYYYNGIWYVKGPQYYRVCRPPYHTEVTFGCCKKGLTSVRFSYYNAVDRSYSAINQNYAIIAEQNRIIAQNNAIIAQQNARLALNSTNANLAYLLASQLGLIQSFASATTPYYYQDGVFYTGSGHNFRTIVPPAGAIIASLPEDYIIVQYGGDPFYRVEDTLYRQFVVDGAPYFEVLGQFPY